MIGRLVPSVAGETGTRPGSGVLPGGARYGFGGRGGTRARATPVLPELGHVVAFWGWEVTAPPHHPRSAAVQFPNEGGVAGTFRLLKNVMGLWIVQECRRYWARKEKSSRTTS